MVAVSLTTLLFAFTCLLTLARSEEDNSKSVPVNLKVPNVFNSINNKNGNNDNKWFAIGARQLSRIAQVNLLQQNHHLEEYFSLAESTSYSLHKASNDESFSFVLLAHRGRIFYAPVDTSGQPISCQLDHRQDYSSQFPWRYSRASSPPSPKDPAIVVLGAGALWLNAIEEQAACHLDALNTSKLICSLNDKRLNVQLSFQWPLPEPAVPNLVHFSLVQLSQLEHEITLMQHVDIDLAITSFQTLASLDESRGRQLDSLIELCERSVATTYLFPSLMKQVMASEHQSFMLSYRARVYDQDHKLARQFSVEEWFSNKLAQQTVIKWDSAQEAREKYFRLFKYRSAGAKRPLNYRAELTDSPDCKCNQVGLEQLVAQLNLVAHLMHRDMHLLSVPNKQQPLVQVHPATLLGVSALLMNAADLQDKRQVDDHDSRPKVNQMGAVDRLEWMLEDGSYRIYLKFIIGASGDKRHVELRLNNLHSIEIKNLVADSDTPEEGQPSETPKYSERLVMEILINQFSSNLYEDELETAFGVPKSCAFREDLMQANIVENLEESVDQSSTEPPVLPDGDDPSEPNYEFPSFAQYLNLAENYAIYSVWEFDNAVSIRLEESLSVEGGSGANGQTLSRLDVRNCESDFQEDEFSVYMRHGDQVMLRSEDDVCYQVEEPNEWLEALSGAQVYGRDLSREPGELRSYGVAALWQVAANSPFVEYLGQSLVEGDLAKRVATWRLEGEPNLPDMSLLFKFQILDSQAKELFKRLRLDSIEVEVQNSKTLKSVRSISIGNILAQPNGAVMGTFLLPASCDSNLKRYHKREIPAFPSFLSTFHGFPQSATFELGYNLYISMGGWSGRLAVTEANKMNGVGRLAVNRGNWIFWMTDEGETLVQQVSSGQCKRVRQLEQFFGVKDLIDSLVGDESAVEDQRSNFLLANLWSLISARVEHAADSTRHQLKVIARTRSLHDDNDQHQQLIEWSLDDKMQGHSVQVTFEHPHVDDPLVLHSILVKSKKTSLRFMVQKYADRTEQNTTLPEQCRQQLGANRLPALKSELGSDGLHMRSELTVADSTDERSQRFFLIDEWIDSRGAYRLKTGGSREHVHDYLIYSDTEEFFNLSKPFECRSKVIPSTWASDWIIDSLHAAETLFGPLALLWLANRPEMRMKELTFSSLDAKSLLGEYRFKSSIEEEQWLVEHPTEPGIEFRVRLNSSSGKPALSDLFSLEDLRWHNDAAVQIINFSRLPPGTPDLENLLIPIGFGCKRGEKAKEKLLGQTRDALKQDRWASVRFDYVSSLALASPEDGGSFKPTPMFQSGYYSKTPTYSLVINQRRNHYTNGSAKSFKQVYATESADETLVQVRTLDEQSGWCLVRVEPRHPSNIMKLYFSTNTLSIEPMIVREDLFDLMSDYELIQRTEDGPGGVITLAYEQQLPEFELSRQFNGPTTIIRTFKRGPRMKPSGSFFYHSDVKIDVFVASKVHLTLKIEGLNYVDATDVVREASTEDCYSSTDYEMELQSLHRSNKRLRNFHLTYLPVSSTLTEFESFQPQLERQLIRSLLAMKSFLSIDLMPSQVGAVSLEFNRRENKVCARFNLLEPPSALEYFVEKAGKAIGPSTRSVTRLIESKFGCSDWCDSSRCLAFAYCPNRRLCQIITSDMISNRVDTNVDEQFGRLLNTELSEDNSCSYHFAPAGRIRAPLDRAVSYILHEIAQPQIESSKLGSLLTLHMPNTPTSSSNRSRLIAAEFAELTKTLSVSLDLDGNLPESILTFADVHIGYVISPDSLGNDRQATTHLTQANTRAECLDICSHLEGTCQLISHCEATQLCLIIGNISTWETLRQVLDLRQPNLEDSCSVIIQDFLPNYRQFSDTAAPIGFMSSESGLNLLECAAKCQLVDSIDTQVSDYDCLSFDFCADSQGQTTCYTQNMHVLMDDFDESILSQKQQPQPETTDFRCSHHSKLLVADYVQQNNRKFANHTALEFKGAALDTCALICRRDDACIAFEYCFLEGQAPPSSCYIERVDSANRQPVYDRMLSDNLEEAANCSVFRMKHADEQFRFELGHVAGVFELDYQRWRINDTFVYSIAALGCIFAALVAGSLVQIMHTIITGRPMPLLQ